MHYQITVESGVLVRHWNTGVNARVFSATFIISWRSNMLVEEPGVP
jgi:hypothetical protein